MLSFSDVFKSIDIIKFRNYVLASTQRALHKSVQRYISCKSLPYEDLQHASVRSRSIPINVLDPLGSHLLVPIRLPNVVFM